LAKLHHLNMTRAAILELSDVYRHVP
jgi:hypothetical protein